jgi:hypothetical protein
MDWETEKTMGTTLIVMTILVVPFLVYFIVRVFAR